VQAQAAHSLVAARSFHGVLRVTQQGGGDYQVRRLLHGSIMHGEQLTAEKLQDRPTSYYGDASGVGRALHVLGARGPLRVGAVGLGTGTLLSYMRPGDRFVVYELDEQVVRVARRWFRFLAHAPAAPEIRLGDARLSMERELAAGRPGGYDLVVVDAFSSDAIPVHLMTQEALGVYLAHLAPGGIVALHISNRYLELAPEVARVAAAHGLPAWLVRDDPPEAHLSHTDWVLVGSALPPALQAAGRLLPADAGMRPWTDGYNNLFRALKF